MLGPTTSSTIPRRSDLVDLVSPIRMSTTGWAHHLLVMVKIITARRERHPNRVSHLFGFSSLHTQHEHVCTKAPGPGSCSICLRELIFFLSFADLGRLFLFGLLWGFVLGREDRCGYFFGGKRLLGLHSQGLQNKAGGKDMRLLAMGSRLAASSVWELGGPSISPQRTVPRSSGLARRRGVGGPAGCYLCGPEMLP